MNLKKVRENVKERARAKINLLLDITGKRPDGYHEVRMIMQTVSLHDTITIEKSNTEGEIIFSSDSLNLPSDKDNLCVKAALAMKEKYALPGGYRIFLKKRIPISAGLAGGSSDAAAVIRGITRLEGLRLTKTDLRRVGKGLGADVPYCIEGGTALSEGIGEILTPLSELSNDIHVLILKPVFSISTAECYKKYDELKSDYHPDIDGFLKYMEKDKKSYELFSKYMGNVLEEVVKREHDEIEIYKDFLMKNGAVSSLMSGSGSSVFGIFFDKETAALSKEKAKSLINLESAFLTTVF